MTATIIRWFAHKSTNAKQRPHSLYVQKKRFYSPFMLTKFEWTMFRNAKKVGENDRWVVSPLIKSCADLPLVSRPLFCISASLSPQRCFFYLSLYLVQFEGCAKNDPVRDSLPRTILRAARTPQDAFSSRNSPFARRGALSIFWAQA